MTFLLSTNQSTNQINQSIKSNQNQIQNQIKSINQSINQSIKSINLLPSFLQTKQPVEGIDPLKRWISALQTAQRSRGRHAMASSCPKLNLQQTKLALDYIRLQWQQTLLDLDPVFPIIRTPPPPMAALFEHDYMLYITILDDLCEAGFQKLQHRRH